MTSWFKYTYVCPTCDALIEITKTGLYTPQTCCNTHATYLSVVDATIPSSTTTKEETMSATSEYMERQNSALLELIEKKDSLITRLQDEVSSLTQKLGADHKNCDYWKSENGRIGSQLIALVDNSYDEELSSDEILTQICEIIDYNPTKTIEFEGAIHFYGTIEVPRSEQDDFDLESELADIYVEINNGNISIDNYEIDSVREV